VCAPAFSVQRRADDKCAILAGETAMPNVRLLRSLAAALGLLALPLAVAAEEESSGAGVERLLATVPSGESYGRHLLELSEEPHMAGTPRNDALADYLRDRFRDYGFDEAGFHDLPALLAYPRAASLEILKPRRQALDLREAPHGPDKDSRLYDDPSQVAFHGYAASGTVSGEVVYANGGSPEDFAELDRMGVNLRDKIVLMRYSDPYSYRGYKVYMAEQRGAAGALVYSDPMEDGATRGPVYPEGPWGPPSHVQWGAIVYDWLGPGEPFTFHWKQGSDGRWYEGPVRDKQLPRIPSMPLSAENAQRILEGMKGKAAPKAWQGGLPIEYRIGPGPVTVRMHVDNDEHVGRLRSVIGVIRGSEEPEKLVVLGNHRDAWNYGAVDPASGTAAMLEVARALGTALKQGHRPRRTIVFANWDGEEHLLGGSTQWVKDNADMLRAGAVTYINVDSAIQGADFRAGATPALARFVRELSREVKDPVRGVPVHDAWAARSADGVPEVETIVGATDYTAFQEHLGISCVDMYYDGPYGVYHSQYDNYFRQSTIVDPGFRYGTTLAQLWGLMAWRLADAPLLPMRYSDYARGVLGYIERAEAHAGAAEPLRLEAARAAAKRWEAAAAKFEARVDAGALPADLRPVNDTLMAVERALVQSDGLAGRPFVKHLLVAPQPTYRSAYLPRIWEAIDRDDRAAIPGYESEVVAAFDAAAGLMANAERQLGAAH
jgi:N-acetylated-alpha-linked acidic dipeptidase